GQTIRNTGTAGGIVALGNSHLELFSSEVRNNVGSGVVLRENSSARIFNNTITGNGGNGVRVIRLSTARLFAPNTITGNGNFDFFCAPNSFASGDKTGVGRMFCPKFDQSPEPMLGPKPDQP
ncbi:MAG: right-handed parallel beta-helix repeat-containing protein, partial [Terriglobia bacterium]